MHLLGAVLVVPAIGLVVVALAEGHDPGWHFDPRVLRPRPLLATGPPQRLLLRRELRLAAEVGKRHLAENRRRCLQMDPFMFDPHQDHPGGRILADR